MVPVMDETQELIAWLEATGRRDLQAYSEQFRRKLAHKFENAEVRTATTRAVSVDWETFELIVLDVVETRVSGPTVGSTSHRNHQPQTRRGHGRVPPPEGRGRARARGPGAGREAP